MKATQRPAFRRDDNGSKEKKLSWLFLSSSLPTPSPWITRVAYLDHIWESSPTTAGRFLGRVSLGARRVGSSAPRSVSPRNIQEPLSASK